MERWERRAEKLESKRKKMRVEGRGLLTVEPLAVIKSLQKRQQTAATKKRRRK